MSALKLLPYFTLQDGTANSKIQVMVEQVKGTVRSISTQKDAQNDDLKIKHGQTYQIA